MMYAFYSLHLHRRYPLQVVLKSTYEAIAAVKFTVPVAGGQGPVTARHCRISLRVSC